MNKIISEAFQYLFPLIQKSAPFIAGIIADPAGIATETAINLIGKAFGAKPNDDLKTISQSIHNDPDSEAKLAELEKKYSELLQKMIDDKHKNENINVTVNINH